MKIPLFFISCVVVAVVIDVVENEISEHIDLLLLRGFKNGWLGHRSSFIAWQFIKHCCGMGGSRCVWYVVAIYKIMIQFSYKTIKLSIDEFPVIGSIIWGTWLFGIYKVSESFFNDSKHPIFF